MAAALRCAHRTGRLSPAVIALELGRIAAGFGCTVAIYFARTQAPSRTVLRAVRLTTPLRLAGLIAAGRGWRRSADTLLATGSLISILLLAYASPASRRDDRAAHAGITAGAVTPAGLLVGVGACVAAATGTWAAALILWLLNRTLDGLDGAIGVGRVPRISAERLTSSPTSSSTADSSSASRSPSPMRAWRARRSWRPICSTTSRC